MAEDPGAPSLEPPSLFGRKKKNKKAAAPPPPPPPPAESATPSAPAEDVRAEPATEPSTWTEVDRRPAPSDPTEPVLLADAIGSAVAEPVVEPVVEPGTEPTAAPRPEPESAPARESVTGREPVAVPDESPTTILDDTTSRPPTPAYAPSQPPAAVAPVPAAAAEPRPPRQPWLTGRPAAVLTGLLVGALIVAATAGSLRLCTAVKGTSSCGGPGLFLLVAILIVAVLVGAALLRAADIPQPGSTSFLAVGLISVVALLFLVGSIFEWWMVIVIPLVSVAMFLLSHWVTTAYIEPENEAAEAARQRELHDIR